VAEYGQPFVLRQLSPATTIGGGRILSPSLRPTDRLKRCLALASGLASDDPAIRLAAYIDLRRETNCQEQMETRLGLSVAECLSALTKLLKKKEIVATAEPRPSYVTAKRFAQLKLKLLVRCREELDRRKPASQVPVSVVLAAMSRYASAGMLQKLLEDMASNRDLIRRGDRVGLPSGAELSQRQRQLLTTLLTTFAAAGRAPPTLKELAEQLKIPQRDLEQLVQVAVDDGQLVKLSPLMAIDREAVEGLRQSLAAYFQQQPTAKVGELREQWGITRKHAVPIFEFFDESQITLRKEELRTPGPKLTIPIGEAAT
jgi:selenocysteine-specific elongation factor